MNTRPFRFGVVAGGVDDVGSVAQRAEALGYATILVPDTTSTPAPLLALAGASARTTSLHVGTWVLCDPLRTAGRLVWEAGTLQAMSAGRFELGIGAGRPGADADAARVGVEFGSPGERVTRLEHTVGVLRDALPHTPIMLAASGPKLLSLAARVADTVAFGWAPTTGVAAAGEYISIVRAEAGSRFDDVELATGLVAVGEDEQPWLTRSGLTPRGLADAGAVTVVTGAPEAMAEQLQRRRDALGLSYYTVPAAAIERFAPVVAAVSGH